MKRISAALVCAAVLPACHERPAVLTPDLAVEFGCAANPSAGLVGGFLSAHGFVSVDEEAVRRREGKKFFPLQIVAYDRRRFMVEVIGFRKPKSYGGGVDYRLTITSPPPTRRDRELEDRAERLVRDTLGCEVHAVNRFVNGPDSITLFNAIFEDEQRRVRDVREKWRPKI